jgi:hypothetical protein
MSLLSLRAFVAYERVKPTCWASGQTKNFSLLVTISRPVLSANPPHTFNGKGKISEKLIFHRKSRLKSA